MKKNIETSNEKRPKIIIGIILLVLLVGFIAYVFISDIVAKNSLRASMDSQLFNNGSTNLEEYLDEQKSNLEAPRDDIESGNQDNAPNTIQDYIETVQKYMEQLENGYTITPEEAVSLKAIVVYVVDLSISEEAKSLGNILNAYDEATSGLDESTVNSIADNLSGFGREIVTSLNEAKIGVGEYLDKAANNDVITSEENAECAKNLGFILDMADIILLDI